MQIADPLTDPEPARGAIPDLTSLPQEAVYGLLGSRPTGLARDEATRRLAADGPNLLEQITRIVDFDHAWLFDPASGVDVTADQSELLSRLIAESVPADPPVVVRVGGSGGSTRSTRRRSWT